MNLLARCTFVLVFFQSLSTAQCELELQEFGPPDGQAGDVFGYRVARAGNVTVVAASSPLKKSRREAKRSSSWLGTRRRDGGGGLPGR